MPEELHPIFRDRPTDDASVWRYMSFAKFAALMQSKRLRFTRIDRFDDHFEGVWPKKDLDAWNKLSPLPGGYTEQMRRARVAATCWINLPNESAAMWRLYAPGAEGVALKTTFKKLSNAIGKMEAAAPGTLAGAAKVQYLDHAEDSILAQLKEGELYPNALLPFMIKHISYAHENEVRGLVVAPAFPNGGFEIESDGCATAELDLSDFIDDVVTSPLSETWFENTVVDLAKSGRLRSVSRSHLHPRSYVQTVVSPATKDG